MTQELNKNENVSVKPSTKPAELKTELTFDDQVVSKIAGMALTKVPGILGLSGNAITNFADRFRSSNDNSFDTKGINVDVGTKQTAIDLSVICEYGVNIANVFDKAVVAVRESVKHMTGLDVVEFNMNVDDVMTSQEYHEKYDPKDTKKEDNDRVN